MRSSNKRLLAIFKQRFGERHTRGLSFRWYGVNVPKVVIVALMRKMITTRRTRHVGADIRDCELRRVWLLRLNARTSPAEKAADAKLHRTRYEPSRSRKPSGGDDRRRVRQQGRCAARQNDTQPGCWPRRHNRVRAMLAGRAQ